jgi:hypothetical protein
VWFFEFPLDCNNLFYFRMHLLSSGYSLGLFIFYFVFWLLFSVVFFWIHINSTFEKKNAALFVFVFVLLVLFVVFFQTKTDLLLYWWQCSCPKVEHDVENNSNDFGNTFKIFKMISGSARGKSNHFRFLFSAFLIILDMFIFIIRELTCRGWGWMNLAQVCHKTRPKSYSCRQ